MIDNPYPVEIQAPDLSPYRAGNTGLEYVTSFKASTPGPHVMLSAVVHGNELCGAIVLDELLRAEVRPVRGTLTLAFMNVEAFHRFDPTSPVLSRYVDEDFNRVWDARALDSDRDSVELRRARALRPLLDTVDYLLDIHSMQHPCLPLMMCGPAAKGEALARALASPEHVVKDAGHAAGRRMRDYGSFSDNQTPNNALLIECGQHWATETTTVAKDIALRFLAHYEVVAPEFISAAMELAAGQPQRVIEVTGPVTIKTDEFRFDTPYYGLETVAKAGTVIGWDGEEPVRTPYDDCVLIMPSRRLRKGESAVRFGRVI